jgi:hypothetical protein
MKTSALAAGGMFMPLSGFGQLSTVKQITVRLLAPISARTRLAVNELYSGLHMLNPAWEVRETTENTPRGVQLMLSIEEASFKDLDDYEISVVERVIKLRAARNSLKFAILRRVSL